VRAAQTHMDRSGLTTGASETGCDGGGEHRLRLPTHLFLQLHLYAFAAQLRSMENEQESPARRIGRSMTAAAARGWRDVRAETIPRPSLSLSPVCLVATNASSEREYQHFPRRPCDTILVRSLSSFIKRCPTCTAQWGIPPRPVFLRAVTLRPRGTTNRTNSSPS
jgi:hypothetical protein